MKTGLVVLLLLAQAAVGAGDLPNGHSAERIYITVADENHRRIEGASVYLLSRSRGEELIEVTDAAGTASIESRRAVDEDALAIVICAENYFCGAIRAREGELKETAQGSQLIYIELAGITLS